MSFEPSLGQVYETSSGLRVVRHWESKRCNIGGLGLASLNAALLGVWDCIIGGSELHYESPRVSGGLRVASSGA